MTPPPSTTVSLRYGNGVAASGTLWLAGSVGLSVYNLACIGTRPDASEWNWVWAAFFAVTTALVAARMFGRWRAGRLRRRSSQR